MTSENGPVNGIWKSVALVTVTVLVAGAPGMIYALRTWSVATRIDQIQERQDDVRTRLAILETRVDNMSVEQKAQLEGLVRIQAVLNGYTTP
jgi:hypothetical protein